MAFESGVQKVLYIMVWSPRRLDFLLYNPYSKKPSFRGNNQGLFFRRPLCLAGYGSCLLFILSILKMSIYTQPMS
jgi:hypothetical protein